MDAAEGFCFVTVGHSTDSLDGFVARLKSARVTAIVDVRTLPGSTKFPHFNSEAMSVDLPSHGISYHRVTELGGLRKRSKDIAPEVNGFWQNRSFHNYADYALSAEFAEGFQALLGLGEHNRLAIMCAEAVWWRCHRRIIADYLIANGRAVEHLMPNSSLSRATLTPGALVEANDASRAVAATNALDVRVTYPAAQESEVTSNSA